ncbi:MAG: hypothetical protein K2X86_02615 [Cytophagaceae bacterium]|nr:hypothetical protein [Cytophagaceae bacterium]
MLRFRKILYCFLIAIILWITTGYFSAVFLTRSHHTDKAIYKTSLPVQQIELFTQDRVKISAWLIEGKNDKAVILLPGIGANRLSSISRAEFYTNMAYAVLMPDLLGTGISEGDYNLWVK